MADYLPLPAAEEPPAPPRPRSRVASLDVFRGLCVFLMMLVDYGGSILPVIAHSPWDGLHLADFVMPFFLFIAGVSLALVYKKVINRMEATKNAVFRAAKLFLLGVFLQGGYLHGIASLTYGVDIERIRWFGILQRISVGYIVAALCEIWLTCTTRNETGLTKSYYRHWFLAIFLSAVYLGLLYGVYVSDWQFEALSLPHSLLSENGSYIYTVKCSTRGDVGPACNSAGVIDRHVVGLNHLYQKPGYRNLEVCNVTGGRVPENSPPWCHAPFDPEGIVSSLPAVVTCIIGLQYGHILANIQDPRDRLYSWFLLSVPMLALGSLLAFIGIPINKSLYSLSYMLITSSSAGITFCCLYMLVDVYGFKRLTSVLQWMGKHSLCIFILVTSNVVVIVIQGFYWKNPSNNLVHWIVARFVKS